MSRDWEESPWVCGGAVAAKTLRRSSTTLPGSKKTPPQIYLPANLRPKASKRLRQDKWRAAFDAEGKPVGFHKLLKIIVSGGVDHSIRAEVWEFLLGCYGLGSTTESRKQTRQARRLRYKELIQECQSMHSSVGTGSLAYTVGSKVMDVRISSKESSRKEAKSALVRISLDSKSPLEHSAEEEVELPKNANVLISDVGLKTQFSEFSEDFGSGRISGVSALSGPLYNMSSPSAHADEGAESEVSDFSFTNGDYIAEFPYLPTVNLFAKEDRKNDAKAARSSGKSSGKEEVPILNRVGSEGAGAVQGQEILNQENSAGVVDSLGVEEEKHMIYGSPIKFDDEPMILDPGRGVDALENPPFLEVLLPTLDDELRDVKSTGTGVLDFPYSLKNGVSEEKVADWLWTLHRIVIDVVRTDRHLEFYGDTKNMARMSDILAVYAWIDSATGYCQGMSDLLSPFILLFEDDADAFWCFESLLRRVRQNFQMEGPVGVMKQLEALPKILELTDVQMSRHFSNVGADSFLFAFRMLLVLFRRELSFGESLFMWEMMWASDFDSMVTSRIETPTLGALVIRSPSMSLQERLKEDDHSPFDWRFNSRSVNGSPREYGNDAILLAKSPFCGLRPGIWAKSGRQKSRSGSGLLQKKGDEELSVFCVAAILLLNRAKLLKEVQSMDDAIKIFNDMELKIRVHKCIQTALRLRKRYSNQVGRAMKRSRLAVLCNRFVDVMGCQVPALPAGEQARPYVLATVWDK